MPDLTMILLFVGGLLLGAAGVAVYALVRRGRWMESQGQLRSERDRAQERLAESEGRVERLEAERTAAQSTVADRDRRLAGLEAELDAQKTQLVAQKELVDDARKRLGETFEAVGARALRANNEQFLALARETFGAALGKAKGEAVQGREAVEALLKPVHALLEKQGEAVVQLEKKREVAYRGLEEQIRSITAAHEKLGAETSRLVTALRRPEQRGRWGEMQLRNVVELAGMTKHCDFDEQVSVTPEGESRQRPDLVVRLPGGGSIVVDAKVSLDAYLDIVADPGGRSAVAGEAARREALQRHARQVQTHVRALASKQYWRQFDRAPKVVVMFMPLETALTAAMEEMPEMHAEAMKSHVLIATPTLLVALLRAVAYGWQQEDVAENARQIADCGRELYDRLARFTSHFERVGDFMGKASRAYNDAVGSLESRLLPSAKRLRDLHVTTEARIQEPKLLDVPIRPVSKPELRDGASPESVSASRLPLEEAAGPDSAPVSASG